MGIKKLIIIDHYLTNLQIKLKLIRCSSKIQQKKKDKEKHITNGETEISYGDYHLCRIMSILMNCSQKLRHCLYYLFITKFVKSWNERNFISVQLSIYQNYQFINYYCRRRDYQVK